MIGPAVTTRMEQRHGRPTSGIDAAEVRSLVQIAAMTGQSEIARIIGATVLLGYDVLDVMDQLAVSLMQAAAFAAEFSAMPDQFPCGRIHRLKRFCL